MDDDLSRRIRAVEGDRTAAKQRYDGARSKCERELESLNHEIARLANSVPGMEDRQSWFYPANSYHASRFERIDHDLTWTAYSKDDTPPRICTPIKSTVTFNPINGSFFYAKKYPAQKLNSRADLLAEFKDHLAHYVVESLATDNARRRKEEGQRLERIQSYKDAENERRNKKFRSDVPAFLFLGAILVVVIGAPVLFIKWFISASHHH